ncbi:MAG: FAD-binding oxidoreductase [Deltaproteobacteria bacterium]|nr:FAD-binding oxidoreductase [Deltaproteobacteria bacterium]
MPQNLPAAVDVAIVGGGVAGLWILHRLKRRGMTAVLIERGPFGDGQTLYSQGILHRGPKYLLRPGGDGSFPDLLSRWNECLEGRGPDRGEPDLRAVRTLSPGPWLLSRSPLAADLANRFEAATELGLVRKADPAVPGTPVHARYRFQEPVLDMASLLAALAGPYAECCRVAADPSFDLDSGSEEEPVKVTVGGQVIKARWLVLAAGEGNEALLQRLGRRNPVMVKRPLKMVCIDGENLPPTWAHALDGEIAEGREGAHFTVTSHPQGSLPFFPPSPGAWWWYVGGDFSEANLPWSMEQIREFLQPILARNFPGVDLAGTRWHLMLVNRAEPLPSDGLRRLEPFVHVDGPVVTVWPLKLVLAPLVADRVVEVVEGGA